MVVCTLRSKKAQSLSTKDKTSLVGVEGISGFRTLKQAEFLLMWSSMHKSRELYAYEKHWSNWIQVLETETEMNEVVIRVPFTGPAIEPKQVMKLKLMNL